MDLSVDELELGVSEWEGRTLVTIGNVSGRVADGTFAIDANTWCGEAISPEGDRVDGCLEDGISTLLDEAGNFEDDPRDFIPEEIGIIVVERNGRYYMDPLGTLGFYTDQVAEVSVDLVDRFGEDTIGVGQFVVVEGPIARQGTPATAQASEGVAAVALDLRDYPAIADSRDEMHVALARVTSTDAGAYVSFGEPRLGSEDWFVVYDTFDDSDTEYPAIGATTDGELTVELYEVVPTTVDAEGLSGTLDDQGRPQLFVFSSDAQNYEIEIDGAQVETISGYEDHGVLIETDGFGRPGSGLFTAVIGDPGESFDIRILRPDPDPDPEPEPEPEPESTPAPTPPPDAGFADAQVEEFELLVNPFGYTYSFEQDGGYFDGLRSRRPRCHELRLRRQQLRARSPDAVPIGGPRGGSIPGPRRNVFTLRPLRDDRYLRHHRSRR